MKLPCAIVRDLLPMYAEKLTEEETTVLVKEHMEECAECRSRLAEIDTGIPSPVESTKPMMTLKREIRRRRLYAVLIAALCVFIGVFTYFFHATSMNYVLWQDGLIEVAGIRTVDPAELYGGDMRLPFGDEAAAEPTIAPASTEQPREALILKVKSFINGFEEHTVVEEDGTTTLIMQALSTNQHSDQQGASYYEYTLYPVPDRLVYGFEQQQVLLWGPPADGGTAILPRLALAYYLIIAAVLAAVCGLAWGIFRKWKFGWILRQLFFAPVSYILSHLILKGFRTASSFMERDLISIIVLTVAFYGLLTVAWLVFLQRRKEK